VDAHGLSTVIHVKKRRKLLGYVNSEDGFCKLLKTVLRQPRGLPVCWKWAGIAL